MTVRILSEQETGNPAMPGGVVWSADDAWSPNPDIRPKNPAIVAALKARPVGKRLLFIQAACRRMLCSASSGYLGCHLDARRVLLDGFIPLDAEISQLSQLAYDLRQAGVTLDAVLVNPEFAWYLCDAVTAAIVAGDKEVVARLSGFLPSLTPAHLTYPNFGWLRYAINYEIARHVYPLIASMLAKYLGVFGTAPLKGVSPGGLTAGPHKFGVFDFNGWSDCGFPQVDKSIVGVPQIFYDNVPGLQGRVPGLDGLDPRWQMLCLSYHVCASMLAADPTATLWVYSQRPGRSAMKATMGQHLLTFQLLADLCRGRLIITPLNNRVDGKPDDVAEWLEIERRMVLYKVQPTEPAPVDFAAKRCGRIDYGAFLGA